MIDTLHISNYALIDSVDIAFLPGLNIITGETGAGKSIMLGALSLLLGGRADTRVVRDPKTKSVIEASFTALESYPQLEALCHDNDIDWVAERLLLRREIAPGGRSRAFINDTPVTLPTLQSFAAELVDIHSQHQNLLLMSPPYQLRIIDSLAGNGERLERFTAAYTAYRRALRHYKEARAAVEQARDQEEYLRYQYEQLRDAALADPAEQEDLERRREVLINLADIKETLQKLLGALQEGEPNVNILLRQATDASQALSDLMEDAQSLTDRLTAARIEVQDVAETFSQYDRNLSADPRELEQIEQRLAQIYDLQRRLKADTVAELIALRDDMGRRLNEVEHSDESLHTLSLGAKRAKKEALDIAHEISQIRHQEAERFAQLLRERALPLGMKNLQCEVSVRDAELSATGVDAVEFLFAFNKNQPLMPVGNTASGGEISRLMLAIKSIVADKMQLPSLIFDEVDTGVSGDVANRMGLMMQQIARTLQVIAITHLPQVAAKGQSHYKVYKEDTDEATVTRITRLTEPERVSELAQMLSGSTVDEAALANARSLLGLNTSQAPKKARKASAEPPAEDKAEPEAPAEASLFD